LTKSKASFTLVLGLIMTKKDIKNRLKELREKINLTQQELADELSISRQSLIALEKGRYRPSFPLMILLEDFFGEPVREIFNKKNSKKSNKKGGKMIKKWLPFRDSDWIYQGLDRNLDKVFDQGFGTAFPKINLGIKQNKLIIEVEVPGISEKDLEIDITEDTFRILGQKREEQEVKKEHYYRRESSYGSFDRTINLPVKIDNSKAGAELADGQLTVVAPLVRGASTKIKKVKINRKR
jgi:HSP20 family protein